MRLECPLFGGRVFCLSASSGANPVELLGRGGNDENLLCPQNASAPGQLAQRRMLRMTAHEAALKEVASSKLRRFLAYGRSFNCADVKRGNLALCYMAVNRKSAPRSRGPAGIVFTDGTGVTVKSQIPTFKV